MKKYRSLWCMSTTNHNILYFAVIPGTFLLNTGICLWKAQISLVRRGLLSHFASKVVQASWLAAPSPCQTALHAQSVSSQKPSPRRGRPQDAKQVQIARETVGVVDNRTHSLDDLGGRRGSWPQAANVPLRPARRTRCQQTAPSPNCRKSGGNHEIRTGNSRVINTFSLCLSRTLD